MTSGILFHTCRDLVKFAYLTMIRFELFPQDHGLEIRIPEASKLQSFRIHQPVRPHDWQSRAKSSRLMMMLQ